MVDVNPARLASKARGLRAVQFFIEVHRRDKELGVKFMAASITFFAFLALFPLILLAMSVVGFIVAEEP